MVKKIGLVLLLIVAVLLSSLITSNLWLKHAIASAVYRITGFPVSIKKANLDLFSSKFEISGIELNNPAGFPQGRFASIPEIYADFDLSQFLSKRRLYVQELRIHIEEIAVVRNELGKTNIGQLKALTQRKDEMDEERQATAKVSSPEALDFFIERLILTIRRFRYRNQAKPFLPEQVINLGIEHEEFLGVSNLLDVIRIIAIRITHKAAIGNLGVPVDILKNHLELSLTQGQEFALRGTAIAQQFSTHALDEGKRLIQEASEDIPLPSVEVDKTVEDVKSKAEGLFRSAGNLLKDTTESVKKSST